MASRILEAATLGGRLPVIQGVTEAKLAETYRILEGVKNGDTRAIAEMKYHLGARVGETLTTGNDFAYNVAQLLGADVTVRWDERDEKDIKWAELVDVETFGDFEVPKTYTVDYNKINGLARPVAEPGKPAHVPPIVPEGSPYPEFGISGELAGAGDRLHKAGLAIGATFEKIVRDPQFVSLIPDLLLNALADREEWDVFSKFQALLANAALALAAGETIDGVPTLPNAALSPEAVDAALTQVEARKVKDKKIGDSVSSWTLLVAAGRTRQANFILNGQVYRSIRKTDAGGNEREYGVTIDPIATQKVTQIIETEAFSGGEWALIPSKGAIRGGNKFVTLGRLRGHEGPEVRVENLTGSYISGGAVAPFEGSFDTDSANFRGRIISGGFIWNPEYMIHSDGSGII